MARIRSIKPEFWSSPSMRGADPWARLLYIAMWNWADDTGRGTANPRELAAFAFPDDEDYLVPTVSEMAPLLSDIQKRFGVLFYEVDGRRYFAIPTWDKHQRNERKAASRYPAPADGREYDPGPPGGGMSRKFRDTAAEGSARSSEAPAGAPNTPERPSDEPPPKTITKAPAKTPSRKGQTALDLRKSEAPSHSHGISAALVGSSGLGTGEQGNRGTGEKEDGAGCQRNQTAARARDEAAAATATVEAYAQRCRLRPPRDVLNGLKPHVLELVQNSWPRDVLDRALDTWGSKRLHHKLFPQIAHEVANAMPGVRPGTDEKVEGWGEIRDQLAAKRAANQQSNAGIESGSGEAS